MQPDSALAAAEGPEIRTMEIYRGVIPFVAIQIVALFILASFPQLATWVPGVVFG
ncbi:hypothetical protein ABWI00_03915 [Algihabitans albus]|uniref:hypothetical protein n=1 Tax=Algihabitans albus TaxID=2164067 RepID=UPI0035CF4D90